MPILTEPESNPRWGFLHGLGATGTEMSSAQINALKPRLYRIYELSTQLFKDIDNAKKSALVTWGTGELEAALNNDRAQFKYALDDLKTAIDTGIYEGYVLRDTDVATMIGKIISAAKSYTETIKRWNSIFPSTKLGEIAAKAQDLLAKIIGTFQDLASAGVGALSWLPWVIGILIIGPPLLKIVMAGRRGGVDSALEETQSSLVRSREAAASAARRAAAIALAPETGGASLALRGYSKRKRRPSRRRG